MTTEQRPYLKVLKALYDYEPTSDDEVAIQENQLLFLIEKTDEEWWTVKLKSDSPDDSNAPSGLIPASYSEEATPLSTVKALYDYDAVSPGELSIKEDEVLHVYEEDEEWLLVKADGEDGLVGYVPGNYVEQLQNGTDPTLNEASRIVIPDSPPPRIAPVYVDPADRVAATADKAKVDDIRTWSVSEVDKKGKKKKGTLGIGNGSIFFASESDKTPVQKWQTIDINDSKLEKSKHLYIEIGGPSPASLHFNVGGKDVAEQIVEKLESSQRLTNTPSTTQSPPPNGQTLPDQSSNTKAKKAAVSVHFAPSPAVIPDPETPIDDEGEEEQEEQVQERDFEGEQAVALYDFAADGEDELTVKEGEQLFILDKVTSDEWWKCRNTNGEEGVVPASYIEVRSGDDDDEEEEDSGRAQAQRAEIARREAAAEAEAKARAAQREAQAQQQKDAERKAKAASVAAQAEKERRDREREREELERRERDKEKEQEREKERERERERELEEEKERERARRAESAKKKGSDKRTSGGESSKSAEQPALKFPREDRLRVWRDRSAQWHTQAEFLGTHKGKIRLHKINGVIIEVPPEKMSVEDVRFVESLTGQKLLSDDTPAPTPQRTHSKDSDDVPLGTLNQQRRDVAQNRPPKKSSIDWFEFFLNAGCEIDDCTRYASAFERDKMDENILPDIKESTLRSLGLREGDIIRVTKAIEQRKKSTGPSQEDSRKLQLARDEEIARALQAEEESGAARATPPNLFSGPNGALKSQPRRGRPQPKGSGPPVNVDVSALSSASDQISRATTPLVNSPVATGNATQPTAKTSTPKPVGFDDDAWTNRPSSTKPATASSPSTSAPAPAPVAAPPAPVVPTPPPPPPPPPQPSSSVPTSTPVATTAAQAVAPTRASGPNQATQGTVSQDQGQFEILAKIAQLRPPSAPLLQTTPISPPVPAPPPSFNAGLGVGSSPLPLGQHLFNQQTGLYQPPNNGLRGPLAPIPSNQGLLNPLIPTNTGINHFVPTRPSTNPPPNAFATPSFQFQPPTLSPFSDPGYSTLPSPPQGFGSPLVAQPTGFHSLAPLPSTQFSGALSVQRTGFGGGLGNPGFGSNGINGGLQPQPTGFNPALFLPPPGQFAPPAPPPQKDVSPASVFAQMKSGTFINNDQGPQSADKYEALRPQPTGWFSQGTTGGY